MKTKIIFVVSILFFISVVYYKFYNNDKSVLFKIDEEMIDIGLVNKSGKSEAIFKIKNIGEADLEIEEIKSDCHCIIPKWDNFPIKSGEFASIKVYYDNHIYGFFEQTISVYIKSYKHPILFVMRGTVIND